MLLINIMIAFSTILFVGLIDKYYTMSLPILAFISFLVLVFASITEFLKVEIFKKGHVSIWGSFTGTVIVFFALGLVFKPFLEIWTASTTAGEYAFLAWLIILACFLAYVPLSPISKIDRDIAKKIEENLGMDEKKGSLS